MKILFLSNWHPFPPKNGSELRIYYLLAALAEKHQVTLLDLHEPGSRPSEAQPLSGIRVRSLPRRAYRPTSPQAIAGLFSPIPRALVDTHLVEMEALIRQELRENDYDLVVASQLAMAAYHHLFAHVPSIFEEVELGIYRSKQEQAGGFLGRWRHRISWFKLSAYLRQIVPRFAACTVVSERERGYLQELVRDQQPIEIVPNGIDMATYREVEELGWETPTLIYTGSLKYFANFDAMSWFVSEVFTLIRQEIPSVRLLVTGDPGGRSLQSIAGVQLTGYVEDVRPLIASADVSVVPLRLGGGTRLKVLEAMALGTPVASTRKGAEGLDVEAGRHLLVADEPSDFAVAVVRLLAERALRDRLASHALQLVSEKYDWPVLLPRFVALVERVAQTLPVPALGGVGS